MYGVDWGATAAGDTAEESCAGEGGGTVVRTCNGTGVWDADLTVTSCGRPFFSHGPQVEHYVGFYGEENRCESSACTVTARAVDTIGHSGIIGVSRCSGWI